MKRLASSFAFLLFCFLSVASASSGDQVLVRGVDPGSAAGYEVLTSGPIRKLLGPYAGGAQSGRWVRTFSLDGEPARVRSGLYEVQGFTGNAEDGGAAPITQGTAYLYEEFARGTLGGYDYRSPRDAAELQRAVRELEGGRAPASGENRYVAAAAQRFGSLERAREPYRGAVVRLMHLSPAGENALRSPREHAVFAKGPDVKAIVPASPLSVLVLSGPDQLVEVATGAESSARNRDEDDDDEDNGSLAGGGGDGKTDQDGPRSVPEGGGGLLLLASAFAGLHWLHRRRTRHATKPFPKNNSPRGLDQNQFTATHQ